MLTLALSRERLQPVRRWRPQVAKITSLMQHIQLDMVRLRFASDDGSATSPADAGSTSPYISASPSSTPISGISSVSSGRPTRNS